MTVSTRPIRLGAALLVGAFCVSMLAADDQVYAPPSREELKRDVLAWIEQRELQETPVLDAIEPLWEFKGDPSAEDLFDALMRTFYLADDEVRQLVDGCRVWNFTPSLLQLQLPDPSRDELEPLLTHNVRYFLARHFAMLTAYDEAVEIFEQIDPAYVVDPAGLFFYRSVCEHHLLKREPGLASLNLLLEQTQDVPVRYRMLAELMQQDLQEVKEKSLGEVSRQMRDVQRQLNLGKAGKTVQIVEDQIIETLDDLIKQLEDQQQQQQAAAGGGGQQSRPGDPADESYLGGIQGEGLTDKKEIGSKDNWGDLPPKAREAAKNMLDRQFPSHYRQAVEEYLKKLADRPAP
jgi:hypothetical protein